MRSPDFEKHSLIPVIIQDYSTLKVLMMAYMNQEAYGLTLRDGEVWFFSRSRNRLWKKGETSGHIQKVRKTFFDCDEDTLLIQVEQIGGAACHEGYVSCFYRKLTNKDLEIVEPRIFDPQKVYK